MYKFDVLTCIYNTSIRNLKTYSNSINSQKILPQNLVVVFDGTKYWKFYKEYLKKNINKNINIKFITKFINFGIPKSLNIGLGHCKNYLIFRLDIDDIWLPNHSRCMLKLAINNPKCLIYFETVNKRIFFDKFLVFDNPSIHSSWVINRKVNKKFSYIQMKPEDYATLTFYIKKFNFSHSQTKNVKYIFNKNSFSKRNYQIANSHLNQIRSSNFIFFLKKYLSFGIKNKIKFFYVIIFYLLSIPIRYIKFTQFKK